MARRKRAPSSLHGFADLQEQIRKAANSPEAQMRRWANEAKRLAAVGEHDEARKALAKAERIRKRAGL